MNITKIASALLMMSAFAAHAASVVVGAASASGITATITPDSSERGAAKVYIAAVYGNNIYFRGATSQAWSQYAGGTDYPTAAAVTLTGAPLTVSVVDFDLASLPGLDLYVGYGFAASDLSKAGHLAKIYTVPSKPVTTPSSSQACDSSQAPSGVSYSQSGNTVNISTNGQCVPLPTASAAASSLCTPPQTSSSASSGQSVLTTVNISSFSLTGITFNIPGVTNPFDSIAQGLGATTTCIRNAPQGYSTYTMNMDVCYDITAAMGSSLQSLSSPYITVSSPITEKLKGTVSSKVVADCFTTSATSVIDATTQEVWIKQGSSFTKVR